MNEINSQGTRKGVSIVALALSVVALVVSVATAVRPGTPYGDRLRAEVPEAPYTSGTLYEVAELTHIISDAYFRAGSFASVSRVVVRQLTDHPMSSRVTFAWATPDGYGMAMCIEGVEHATLKELATAGLRRRVPVDSPFPFPDYAIYPNVLYSAVLPTDNGIVVLVNQGAEKYGAAARDKCERNASTTHTPPPVKT